MRTDERKDEGVQRTDHLLLDTLASPLAQQIQITLKLPSLAVGSHQ